MDVSGRLYALAALLSEKGLHMPIGLGEAPEPEDKNFPSRESNQDSSVMQPVT